MLRLTLELLPHGDVSRAKVLGVLEIANVGGDHEVGQYHCTMKQPRHRMTECDISFYPRKSGAWSLVMWVLAKIKFYAR